MIESKMVLGLTASEEANDKTRELLKADADVTPQYMVFEVTVDGSKTHYCCWSGGEIVGGEVALTDVGYAALEVLMGLPSPNKTLVFQQLKIGRTPLQEKVIAALREAPEGTSICFFGDMAKELDGQMSPAFNVTGAIKIAKH